MKTDLLWWQKAWVSALSEGECSSWRHSPKSNASETRITLISPRAKRCNFSFNTNHQGSREWEKASSWPGHWLLSKHCHCYERPLLIWEWAAGTSWHRTHCSQPSSILRMLLMKLGWAWLMGLGSWVTTSELLLVPHWNTAETHQGRCIFEPLKENELQTPRSTFLHSSLHPLWYLLTFI